MELDLEEIDLPATLESSITIIKEKAHNNGVRLSVDVGDYRAITADARKMKQILFNLLSNAVKFTPAGGSVTLDGAYRWRRASRSPSRIPVPVSARRISRNSSASSPRWTVRSRAATKGRASASRSPSASSNCTAARSASKARLGEGSTFTVRLPIGVSEFGVRGS